LLIKGADAVGTVAGAIKASDKAVRMITSGIKIADDVVDTAKTAKKVSDAVQDAELAAKSIDKISDAEKSAAKAAEDLKGAAETTRSAEKSISRKVIELKNQGFQEHHIISNKNNLTKEHELFGLAGYNTPADFLQSQRNKIYLPSDASLHTTRSIHKGRHLNSVSQNLADQMDAVVMQGNMEGWTTQQFNDALSQILKDERAELRSGKRILNKNHR